MAPIHDLYQRYAGDVFRFALSLTGDRAEAEDITADTFVRLWTAPGDIRMPTIKGYLFTIARRLFLDRRRSQARLTALDPALPAAAQTAEDRAAVRSEMALVRRVIGELPEGDRAALLMRAGGLPYEEIAQALAASVGAVKVRVHRARKRLIAARAHGEKT